MYIPKVACVRCGVAMKCEKNSVTVEALSTFGSYYKIEADRYECPDCGVKVLTAFASQAIAEHYQPGYADIEVDEPMKLQS